MSDEPRVMTWYQLHPDLEPLDQGYDDVPSSPGVSRWGQVGPEGRPPWSWTILALDDVHGDQWTEASGFAATEAQAKAAVESWRPPVSATDEPCIECPPSPPNGIHATPDGTTIVIERCDACGRYEGDLDAALALARLIGGTVKFEQHTAVHDDPTLDREDVVAEIRTFVGIDHPDDCIAFGTQCWIEGANLDRFATLEVISAASPPCARYTPYNPATIRRIEAGVSSFWTRRILAGMGF